MNLTVNGLDTNGYDYEVIGDGITSKVWYLDKWTNKVTGKGSRKHKEDILQAVQQYIAEKEYRQRRLKEQSIAEQRDKLTRSTEYKNIDLLRLYEVNVQYYDTYHRDFMNYNTLKTGYEIIQSDRVVSFKDHHINNTDIYSIGHTSDRGYMAKTNKRIFIVSYHVYVTGLALKEMIHNGMKSYGDIRLIKDVELRTIQQYGESVRTSFMLFDNTPNNEQQEMKQRYIKELERAKNTKFEAKKQYTQDGREINKAWFISKPTSFKDIERMEVASYEGYVVDEVITVNKDIFDKFRRSFDMSVLPLNKPFEGGTYQENNLHYNSVLELKCNEYDYKLLIDPQGFDYARYVAKLDK